MAYDERLAERVRRRLSRRKGVTGRGMFGGLAFLLDGHMGCGVIDRDPCLPLGPDGAVAAVCRRHVPPMDFTGRPLKGRVFVSPAGGRTDARLAEWVAQAAAFAPRLPPK